MSATIYYFTGTGNSLALARGLATRVDAELVPMAAHSSAPTVAVGSDIIGLVTPVYYMTLPIIVRTFVQKLTGVEDRYLFAVCNYGGAAGSALRTLRRLIRARGGTLAGAYGIHMPQNAFPKSWEQYDTIYARADARLETIAQNAKDRKHGRFLGAAAMNTLLAPIAVIVKPLMRSGFRKLSGASKTCTLDDLIHLNDTSFSVDEERCTGCGLCVRCCPVGNIELDHAGGRPVWKHRCENCLACYNWCPTRAIRTGIAKEGYYYRHREITIADIKAQAQRSGEGLGR